MECAVGGDTPKPVAAVGSDPIERSGFGTASIEAQGFIPVFFLRHAALFLLSFFSLAQRKSVTILKAGSFPHN